MQNTDYCKNSYLDEGEVHKPHCTPGCQQLLQAVAETTDKTLDLCFTVNSVVFIAQYLRLLEMKFTQQTN